MSFAFKIIVALVLFSSVAAAQNTNRERSLQKIDWLNSQIKDLEAAVLQPDAADLKTARAENFNVFRLMPREKFDRKFTVQGGGSYFSFTTGSHDYQKIAQIGLEQNHLKVGFAGADYGFLYDLGDAPLADISKETSVAAFLLNYKPPAAEPEIRREQQRARNYDANGVFFKDRLPSIVGHAYLLRSINFGKSDTLVAFKVHRTDADGSQVIFWKSIADFPIAQIERSSAVVDSSQIVEAKTDATDYEMVGALQNILIQKGLINVTVEATNEIITLRGNIPKGRLAETIRVVQETAKRAVRNELTERQ